MHSIIYSNDFNLFLAALALLFFPTVHPLLYLEYPRDCQGYNLSQILLFRWFKFTLKPPNRITRDKL